MAQTGTDSGPSHARLDALLDRLFAVKSWSEARQLIEENPELLSTDADARITARFQDLSADDDDYFFLALHQQFLSRCRDAGLDAAFEDLSADLPPQAIFDLLNALMAPGSEPRRIVLTHRLLSTAPLDRLPSLWAMVVDDLGKSLLSTGAGSREANVERALFEFCRALSVRTRHDMPLEWSETLSNLAMAFRYRVQGDRAENLEQAIALCGQALEVHPSPTAPASLKIRRLLAEIWSERPQGDHDDNLDQAIRICAELEESLSREDTPIEWAGVSTDLARFRLEQRRGDPVERTEAVIEALEQALEVLDRERSPEQWGCTASYLGAALSLRPSSSPEVLERAVELLEGALAIQLGCGNTMAGLTANNLAACYSNRVRGDRAENLERAIEHFEEVLRTGGLNPPDQRVLYNLALTYSRRVAGDRSDNLERAIAACERALGASADRTEQAELSAMLADFYRDRLRGDRAENHDRALSLAERAVELGGEGGNNPTLHLKAYSSLGAVYFHRARGDRERNLEKAAEAYEVGLRGASPDIRGWVESHTTLARLYTGWLGPDREEKIERALECSEEAFRGLSREADPFAWAEAMHARGDVYNWRVRGDRAENLEKAIDAYRAALEVRTAAAAPIAHLDTLNQLAGALRDRRLGEEGDNRSKALHLYREAVEKAPEDVMPGLHRALQGNLGRLLFYLMDWRNSAESLQAALRASERLYQASATPEGKLAELREVLEYPPRIAYCLAQLGQPAEALEALEGNRGRLLAETLDLEEAEIQKAPEADRLAFEAARQNISRLETEVRALEPGSSEAFVEISGKLRTARGNLAAVVERLRSDVPDFLPAGLDLPALAALTRKTGQPLVFLVSSPHGSLALAVAPGKREPQPIWLDGMSSVQLRDLLSGSEGEPGYMLEINSGDPLRMKAALGRLRSAVEDSLIAPLGDALAGRGFREVTLVPCGTLGLLPLPALLGDHLAVSLIPSARAWKSALDAAAERATREPRLFAVDNPAGDLPFTALEADAIESHFAPTLHQRLSGRTATRAGVIAAAPGVTHFNFGCHGAYSLDRPLESTLGLADSELLKVRDLLDGTLDLSASRLVVLSACETGIFDIRTAPDEVLGFPAAFLQAGAPAVISSLWRVSDFSTPLLLAQFYHLHLKDGLHAAEALRQARLWLRSATAAELGLEDFCRKALEQPLPSKLRSTVYIRQRQARQQPESVPFADPYYWAPFVLHGAAEG